MRQRSGLGASVTALVLFHMTGLAGLGSAERKGQLSPQFLGYGREGGVGFDLRESNLL